MANLSENPWQRGAGHDSASHVHNPLELLRYHYIQICI